MAVFTAKRKSTTSVLESIKPLHEQPEVRSAAAEVAKLRARADQEQAKCDALKARPDESELLAAVLKGEPVNVPQDGEWLAQQRVVNLYDLAIRTKGAELETARETAKGRVLSDVALIDQHKAMYQDILDTGAQYRDAIIREREFRSKLGQLGYGQHGAVYIQFAPGAVDVLLGHLARQLRAHGMDIAPQPVYRGSPM